MNSISQKNMPFFDMENSKDLYKKLENDFNKLTNENPNPYDYMNFIFTANHLIDWIKEDSTFDKIKQNEALDVFDFKMNKEYDIIKSLCNRSKHFKKDKYDKSKAKTEAFSFGNINFNDLSFEGSTYIVEMDGQEVNLYNICKEIFEQYKKFFI